MTIPKKLSLITFLYVLVSLGVSILIQEYPEGGWLRSHVQWTYLVWSFRGPLSAVEYGWHGLAPVWQPLSAFLVGGPVVVGFLGMPLWFRGRVSARLCGLGLLLWAALAASLFGTSDLEAQIDRLIAVTSELR